MPQAVPTYRSELMGSAANPRGVHGNAARSEPTTNVVGLNEYSPTGRKVFPEFEAMPK